MALVVLNLVGGVKELLKFCSQKFGEDLVETGIVGASDSELLRDGLVGLGSLLLVQVEMQVDHRVAAIASLDAIDVVEEEGDGRRTLPARLFKFEVELCIDSVDGGIVAAAHEHRAVFDFGVLRDFLFVFVADLNRLKAKVQLVY